MHRPTPSLLRLSVLSIVALIAACAGTRGGSGSDVSPQMSAGDDRLQTYRIQNWSVPDDRTILIESIDGTHYRAHLTGYCPGLRFTQSLGFETRGGFDTVDQFSGIVLPDGTRCQFTNFEKVDFPRRTADKDTEKATQQQSDKAGESQR